MNVSIIVIRVLCGVGGGDSGERRRVTAKEYRLFECDGWRADVSQRMKVWSQTHCYRPFD